MDDVKLKRELLDKALVKVMENANVPAHLHLKLIAQLHKVLQDHARDRDWWAKFIQNHQARMTDHEKRNARHDVQLSTYDQHLKEIAAKDWTGPKGDMGEPGEDADEERIAQNVMSRIHIPEDGRPGEKGEPGKAAEEESVARLAIQLIQKEQLLDVTHVKNIRGFIKDGVKYNFEELMHGGGSQSSSGISIIAVTGTVNDTNKSFSAASEPTLLNINGAFYQQTGGAITWTYSGGAITLSAPAGTGGQIFGV